MIAGICVKAARFFESFVYVVGACTLLWAILMCMESWTVLRRWVRSGRLFFYTDFPPKILALGTTKLAAVPQPTRIHHDFPSTIA